MIGTGIDIVETKRIASAHQRTPRFAQRILSAAERDRLSGFSEGRQVEFLAGRFAAKEAFAKALGTGIGKACAFRDIDVRSGAGGVPLLYFKGRQAPCLISISHAREYAVAQVLLLAPIAIGGAEE